MSETLDSIVGIAESYQGEIDELRAALAERDKEIERLKAESDKREIMWLDLVQARNEAKFEAESRAWELEVAFAERDKEIERLRAVGMKLAVCAEVAEDKLAAVGAWANTPLESEPPEHEWARDTVIKILESEE